jgi:hypothetical protein
MASIGLINLGILPLLLEAMMPAHGPHDLREQESGGQQREQDAKAGAFQSSTSEQAETRGRRSR